MPAAPSNTLLAGLFAVQDAACLFDDHARIHAMLQVEAALARVQARLGIIPADTAAAIAQCCDTALFDLPRIADALAASGNVAIPLVQQLIALVRERSPQAAGYVHWGATSQDILDSGQALQLRAALDLTELKLRRVTALLAALCQAHAGTPLAGRTWMQHAVPVTFGLKAAGWLSALLRDAERLTQMRSRVLALQFGGAAGTLASLGERGLEVAAALAQELGLALPELPWHGARDRVAEVGTTYALLSGNIAKIARDLSLLMQTEIAELAEGAAPGRGGSSTMPHKRNPVGVAATLACTLRVPALAVTLLSAMPQENERGLGGWGAEWEILPDLCTLILSAISHLEGVLTNLEVFPEAMRRNLELTHGLLLSEAVSMRLASHVGRDRAHKLLQQAGQRALAAGQHLQTIVAADPEITRHLSPAELNELFQPGNYLGSSAAMIDRVLATYRAKSKD